MAECPHGYPSAWGRHCIDCRHADEISELEAEVTRLREIIGDFVALVVGGKLVRNKLSLHVDDTMRRGKEAIANAAKESGKEAAH